MSENNTATARTAAGRASDVSDRLQHLRNLLSSQRHGNNEQRRAMEALDREMAEIDAEPISARLERRRRDLEAQIREVNTALPSESPPGTNTSSITRSRRRVLRPSERLLRHRERLLNQSETLHESSAPSEQPPPPIEPSEVAIQEYLEEAEVNGESRWRAKRRKLDDGTFEDDSKSFVYGYKGSVMEGPLRMEIVSCDGGEYSEPNGDSSLPQHALRDDSTVYCTKSNRCNMLLKHIGGMPFSLTKVTIKAPDDGYDAPIQEGMIFVSLDDDQLLEKTSLYEIRYSPKSYRHHCRRLEPRDPRYWRPSHEYLHFTRSPLRSIDRSSFLRDPYPPPHSDENDQLLETALVPGFTVTTTFDSDSDHDQQDDEPSWRSYGGDFDPRLLMRAHRELDDHYRPSYNQNYVRPRVEANEDAESDISSASDEENPSTDTFRARRARFHDSHPREPDHDLLGRMSVPEVDRWSREHFDVAGRARALSMRRETPSRIELRSPWSRTRNNAAEPESPPRDSVPPPRQEEHSANGTQTPPASTKLGSKDAEPLAPHARFFIRRDKSAVTVKFEPPV